MIYSIRKAKYRQEKVFELKTPILFDGAFGTYYEQKTGSGLRPELANLYDRETVVQIHREYIDAGSMAIKTNTYGVSSLAGYDEEQRREILESGYALACEAAKDTQAVVFADMGQIVSDTAEQEYREMADVFLRLGATRFLFETLWDFSPLTGIVPYIKKKVPESVIIVSFAVSQDGYTKTGEYYEDLIKEASLAGGDYVGLNCICGPVHLTKLIAQLDTEQYAVSAMPNSGYPAVVDNRTVYMDNPAYFSNKLYDLFCLGAQILGGCCGTTPEHIRASAEQLKKGKASCEPIRKSLRKQDVPAAQEQISIKRKRIAIEIKAPLDTDISPALEAARKAKKWGADFVTVTDSPLARARADSMMTACRIQREVGISAVPHLSCRDKNQIAMKGALLSGHMEGIRQVLVVTGDPISQTERNSLKNVFNFNSFKLIHFIRKLNEDVFSENPYRIFGALNVNALHFENELQRAQKKLQSGAGALITQPVYSQQNLENVIQAKTTLNCPILVGIMPVASYKNALFLNNEVQGIEIPHELVESLYEKEQEEVKELSLDYCKGIMDRVWDRCDGFYLVTPFHRLDFTEELAKYIKTRCDKEQ